MQHDPAMDMPDFVTEGYEEVEQSGASARLYSAALHEYLTDRLRPTRM